MIVARGIECAPLTPLLNGRTTQQHITNERILFESFIQF